MQWADVHDLEGGKSEESEGVESGESDTDHEIDATMLKISEKTKMINGRRSLKKFLRRNLAQIDGSFQKVEC